MLSFTIHRAKHDEIVYRSLNKPLKHPAEASHNNLKIAICGFGMMGKEIAIKMLIRGCAVRVYDIDHGLMLSAPNHVRTKLAFHFPPTAVEAMMHQFSTAQSLNDLMGNDVRIVVEAATEDIDLKIAIFRKMVEIFKVDCIAPGNVLMLSNTVSCDLRSIVSRLAPAFRDRCIGLRFLQPAILNDDVLVRFQSMYQALFPPLMLKQFLAALHLRKVNSAMIEYTSHGNGLGPAGWERAAGVWGPYPECPNHRLCRFSAFIQGQRH